MMLFNVLIPYVISFLDNTLDETIVLFPETPELAPRSKIFDDIC